MDNYETYYGNDVLMFVIVRDSLSFIVVLQTFTCDIQFFLSKIILHVHEITKKLLSLQKLCLNNNVFFEFHSTFFVVKDEFTRTTLLTSPSEQGFTHFTFLNK